MQNVAQGTVSDSEKEGSSQSSGLGDKCQTFATLPDKFCISSAESESEEEIVSGVDSFVLGDGEEEIGLEGEVLGNQIENSGSIVAPNSNYLLAAAHASVGNSVGDFCVSDCGGSGSGIQPHIHHRHHHSQPQIDPDTQARLVALLEAAVSSSSDPEVLRRLTSSVSSALDEAAAALTRMRSDTASGAAKAAAAAAAAAVTVGGGSSSSSSNSCNSSSSSSSSISSKSCSSSSSSSSRSSSTPGQRTLVEACSDGDLHTVRKLLDEGRSVNETTDEGESLLSLTCSAGYFDLAQVLLAMRANVEDRGIKGDCTPLMEAASAGHVDIVKLLLVHNADVNAQSSSGNTPLMYACTGGHSGVVKVLLDNGANVEDHNENGHTPLMEAASAGHVDVARLLLEKGAGINTSSNEFKESALTLACYKGHLEMVKFLLAAGADQEHKTDEMHTALMEASMDGHVEVARLLLDSGAQVNMPADSFESPLTLAACGGHTDLALLLLERGASIEEVNDEGYTPLMEAAREGHEEMVTLLLAHAADINAQTEETQETALTLACCGGFKEVASILIRNGADLELGSSTPLMEASQEGHRELVEFLINSEANVNAQTMTGDTALTYASENGHTDVAELLLQANADLEHLSEGGRTPLMKACRAGHFCTVQFLILKGADVNKTTADNDHTPLSLACVGGHTRVVELLLAHGSDPLHKLKDNSTMLMEASKGGHTSVVKMLIDFPNSISHLLPIVAPPTHSIASATGELVLESTSESNSTTSTAHHLSMGLSVVPNADQQQASVVLNSTNQILLPDIGQLEGSALPVASNSLSMPVGSASPVLQHRQHQQQAAAQSQKNKIAKSLKKSVASPDKPPLSPLSKEDYLDHGSVKGTATLLDALKREADEPHNTKEDQLMNEQHLLEQLQRVEQQMQATIANNNPSQATVTSTYNISSGTIVNALANSGSVQNSVGGSVVYPSGNISTPTSNTTHTVETQTGFLSPSAFTVLQPSGIGDIPSLKSSNPLQQNLFSGAASQSSIPLSPAEVFQNTFTGFSAPSNCHQEGSSSIALGSSSPTVHSPFTAASPSSAAVPVQERRIMVPSKKQLDKKKFQLQHPKFQVQHQIQQHQQVHPQSPHQCVLQSVPVGHNLEASYNCMGSQNLLLSQANTSNSNTISATTCNQVNDPQSLTPPPPPPPPLSSEAGAVQTKAKTKGQERMDSKEVITNAQQSRSKEVAKTAKLDKKRAITSHRECDCGGIHDEHLDVDGPTLFQEHNNFVPAMTSLGTSLQLPSGLGATSGLQFVSPGNVSSPHLQFTNYYGQIGSVGGTGQPLSQSTSGQSPATINAQQMQVPSTAPISSSTTISTTLNRNAKSQAKQIVLQQPQLATNNQRSGNLSSSAISSNIQPQQQAFYKQPLDKKGKKATSQTLQQSFHEGIGCVSSSNIQSTEQSLQPNTSVVTGITLDPVTQNVVYQNNISHFPGTSLPPNTFPNSLNDNGLMVASPATQAKILNDHLPDIVSSPNSQVANTQLGVPYTNNDANLYAGNTVCHYPSPIDLDSATDSNHDTALTLACAGGHEELVQLLISRGANIEHCDKKGFTPLILAATAGHAKVVEILLNHNAIIEAQSERTKDTPLCLACSGGKYEVVELLLARGANKEHRNVSDYTPLSLAASGGYVNIIKLLLEHGAEINSRTGSKLGISPLMLAAMNGHTQAVKLLLDMGSDINAQIETNRNTALTLACFQGRHEVVSLLLDRKANVEHRAKTGLTPLMEAASGGYVEVGRVLLDKGADVNAPPVPSSRDTALTIAADKGHLKFVELLISRGAQVEVKNKKGNSPMWLAANGGHLEVVHALLNASTDINSEDNRKVSCLMAAFKKGHVKLVKFMVRHVSQFPSDPELDRYILTLNEEELKKKCKACFEIIHSAKEKQALEANRNASQLLEILEKEKSREESKKASQQRKKDKKRAKKQEKREEKKRKEIEDSKKKDEGDNKDINYTEEKISDIKPSDLAAISSVNHSERRAKNERIEQSTSEEKDGDSGIDSNSQTSASSETKGVEQPNPKGKKKKKKKESVSAKETKGVSSDAPNTTTTTTTTTTTSISTNTSSASNNPLRKSKSAVYASSETTNTTKQLNVSSSKTATNLYQNTSSGSSTTVKFKKKLDDDPKTSSNTSAIDLSLLMDMKPVGSKKHNQDHGSRVNALDTFGEVDPYLSSLPASLNIRTQALVGKSALGTSPKKPGKREDGWKEVSRKGKRVIVPNNAISRVIGRGGCNINTIREVSGAHIEVEKQGKSQGDRMIMIKGSPEAMRQAQNLINALVKDPEKDLSELLRKSVIKIAPKPAKSATSYESATQSMPKNIRQNSNVALTIVTSTTTTSVYSSAKSNMTTVSAWANITSPKRTAPFGSSRSSTSVNLQPPKSPAVRQLFPGSAATSSAIKTSSSDVPPTFAAKLTENKSNTKATVVPPNTATKLATSQLPEKKEIRPSDGSQMASFDSSDQQYSIFSNVISQVTQQVAFGGKEKPISFARAASGGLQSSSKTPLGQQMQIASSSSAYLEPLDNKLVDASRAPGYRGTNTCTSTIGSVSGSKALASPVSIPTTNDLLKTIVSSVSTLNSTDITSTTDSVGGISLDSGHSKIAASDANPPLSISSSEHLQSPGIVSSQMSNAVQSSLSTSSLGTTSHPSLARSAPGTPVASPSLRSVVPPLRQITTPPPAPRPLELSNAYDETSAAPSVSSFLRLSMPQSSLAPGNQTTRSHTSPANLEGSFSSAMYATQPPPGPVSIANLAPGGPVSNQRPALQHELSDVNLAVGQPYRKSISDMSYPHQGPPPMLSHPNQSHVQQQHLQQLQQSQQQQQQQAHLPQHSLQQPLQHSMQQPPQHALQQQPQHSLQQLQQPALQQQLQQSQGVHQQNIAQLANLMGGLRFTTPQTNTQPIFSNNIIAPISSAPHIQSNLNPNAPDFASRATSFVSGTYPPRSQLGSYQNSIPTVPHYSGVNIGQFPASLDSNNIHLQAGLNEVMTGLLQQQQRNSNLNSAMTSTASFRSVVCTQDSPPQNSPHYSNPSSPTQSVGGVMSGAASGAGGAHFLLDDRHSKVQQPIGTERAAKRGRVNIIAPGVQQPSQAPALAGVNVVGGGNELLWAARQEMLQGTAAAVAAAAGMPSHHVESAAANLQTPQGQPHQQQQANLYYPQDLDLSSYSTQLWNWRSDMNQ